MQHVARYLAGLGLALSFGFAHAQTPGSYGLHERSIERINGAKDLGVLSADTLFGEQVSLFNGSTTFENVDISIPGNSGLPVELRRKLNVDDRSRLNGQHLLGFGEWDVDVPYASLRRGNGTTVARQVTYRLAARVEDRFGKWVNFTYSGDKLTAVTANDGRQIPLGYSDANIVTADSSVGTWTCAYVGTKLRWQRMGLRPHGGADHQSARMDTASRRRSVGLSGIPGRPERQLRVVDYHAFGCPSELHA